MESKVLNNGLKMPMVGLGFYNIHLALRYELLALQAFFPKANNKYFKFRIRSTSL